MVFTNVPGPTAPVTMFRNQVTEMTFGVGNLVNQVSVVSYAGKMGISLVVDPDEVPDAHLIVSITSEKSSTRCSDCERTSSANDERAACIIRYDITT